MSRQTEAMESLRKALEKPEKEKLTVTIDGAALKEVSRLQGILSAKEAVSNLIILGAKAFDESSEPRAQL